MSDQPAPWPNSPPVEGQLYEFTCPTTGALMVACTKDTIVGYGTALEGFRRSASQLEKRLKELQGEHAALQTIHAELNQRHMNLREASRKQRLNAIEGVPQIETDSRDFSKLTKQR